MKLNESTRFLRTLFPKDTPGYVLVWGAKRSQWVSIAALHKTALLLRSGWAQHDVYFGCGLSGPPRRITERCPAKEIAVLTSLWADLDYAEPRRKKVYPPDQEAALACLAEMPVKTSLLVDSGGGLHAYWLFREPWILKDEEEHEHAATLVELWQDLLRRIMHGHGWTLDATHDLARVLRLPGTFNLNYNPARPCSVIDFSKTLTRYNSADLWDLFEAPSKRSKTPVRDRKTGGKIVLDGAASPPFDKFQALLINEKRFKRTYERERRDFPSADYSASTHDMSLAWHTLAAGWSDQEVANLLIAFRRKHWGAGSPEHRKILRPDYIERYVLVKVHQSQNEREAINKAQSTLIEATEAGDKKSILEALEHNLGIKILRFVQMGADEKALFYLGLPSGRLIELGDSDDACDQGRVRSRLFACAGAVPDDLTRKRWKEVLRGWQAIKESFSLSESDRNRKLMNWLRDYVQSHGGTARADAVPRHVPFVEGDTAHIYFGSFKRRLHMQGEKVTDKQLESWLKHAGFQPRAITVYIGDKKRLCRSYYCGKLVLTDSTNDEKTKPEAT